MPELPEVETIRRGIQPHVVGRTIEKVIVRDRRLRWPVPRDFSRRLTGCRIGAVSRRAKYLLLDVGTDTLLLHLGMSGRLLLLKTGAAVRKHDHLDFLLSGGLLLRFHDPRRFGAALLWRKAQPEHALLRGLGPEPFSKEFSGDYLFRLSRGRSAPVKNFVMDGRVVVGAGNIYAAEALFRAGLRPARAAGRVTRAQYSVLADKVREVLAQAVEKGGTTLRDFFGADGEPGYFAQALNVYGRHGEPCRVCKTPVRRIVLGQRSTFYCPRCQR